LYCWTLSGWSAAIRAALSALEAVLQAGGGSLLPMGVVLFATLAAWVAYVPLHELLHAFGCLASGGRVTELQIQPLYGGSLLEKVFPFVRAGGEYAGRLSRFDTGGSDLTYLATDLAPFLLTVLGAFPLLELARRRRSAILFGAGVVLAAAPLMSLPGDLYEMGSILVTAGHGGLPQDERPGGFLALRHDDLMSLMGEFGDRFPTHRALWASAVGSATLVGWLIGNAILLSGRELERLVVRACAADAQAT